VLEQMNEIMLIILIWPQDFLKYKKFL
jgi:hypothetical protein